MLEHYLAAALRSIRRTPLATAINVAALALGLACFIVAYGLSEYWQQSERHFANAERTYVVTMSRGGAAEFPESGPLVAKHLRVDFPDLEAVARLRPRDVDDMGELSVSVGDKKMSLSSAYADPEFLHIFDLPFIAGDPTEALRDPNSVVITEEAAFRLFGAGGDALGRRVRLDNQVDAIVSGVIGPVAEPSHLGRSAVAAIEFDLLATADVHDRLLARAGELPGNTDSPIAWFQRDYLTYVLLPERETFSARQWQRELRSFAERHVSAQLAAQGFAPGGSLTLGAVPVKDLTVRRLDGILFSGVDVGLSVTTLLLVLGALVLVVACLNYANLATALATMRTQEVGLRRVVGANRGQVALQYISEAAVLTVAALALAMAVVAVLVAMLDAVAGIDLGVVLFAGPGFWLFLAALVVGVGILAGAYPALVLSRVRPVEALRSGTRRRGRGVAAGLLVGMQFAAASFLLIMVIVMYAQNKELRRSGIGAAADRLAVITHMSEVTGVDPQTLRAELLRLPQVEAVAGYRELPWSLVINVRPFARSPEPVTAIDAYFDRVDHDFFDTMAMPVLAGRIFDRARGDDVSPAVAQRTRPDGAVNVVADRAFVEQLGFASPQDAVNSVVYLAGGRPQPVRIIGVVENRPLHLVGMGAASHVYFLEDAPRFMIVRLSGNDLSGALAAIDGVWQRLAPDLPLQLDLMDSLFDRNYALFGRLNQAFAGLALFAFLISMMGLFAMATHMANRRVQEIGIRKTLGASTRRILMMLLREFSRPVVIANLVAWPLAFFAAQLYLSVFIQRIELSPLPFLGSLALTLVVAWLALSFQTIRAARVRPAMVLRHE